MQRIVLSGVFFLVVSWVCGQTLQNEKPSNFPGALSFYVIGDWGRDGKHGQMEVSQAMDKTTGRITPKFIISTGDNFYPDGVKTVTDKQWQTSFEKIYTSNALQCPWYVVLGNHDYHLDPQPELDYSKSSKRWKLPARYYVKSVPVGADSSVKADFIFIDTTPLQDEYYQETSMKGILTQDTTKQLRWIDSVLQRSTARWKFVVGHHHVYTAGKRISKVADLRKHLERILIRNRVDVYFCGHEHSLQHIKPEMGTTNYFVSGAGSEVTPTQKIPIAKFAASQSGFLAVSISNDVANFQFIDSKGSRIYFTELRK
jgi:tartrate-resistant acid phosphatase type 5